jgi:hypothetical protein
MKFILISIAVLKLVGVVNWLLSMMDLWCTEKFIALFGRLIVLEKTDHLKSVSESNTFGLTLGYAPIEKQNNKKLYLSQL